MKIEIVSGEPRSYHYRLKADNGEIMASSETYPTEAHAQRGVEDLRRNFIESLTDAEVRAEARNRQLLSAPSCWSWLRRKVKR